jgi:hypothetical protein
MGTRLQVPAISVGYRHTGAGCRSGYWVLGQNMGGYPCPTKLPASFQPHSVLQSWGAQGEATFSIQHPHTIMKRTKKRPRQRSPSPSPTPSGRSDARPQSKQSNAADSDIVVNDGSDTTSGLQSRASQTRQANNSLDTTDHDELRKLSSKSFI